MATLVYQVKGLYEPISLGDVDYDEKIIDLIIQALKSATIWQDGWQIIHHKGSYKVDNGTANVDWYFKIINTDGKKITNGLFSATITEINQDYGRGIVEEFSIYLEE
jgi:hypothetical protein